MWLAPREIKDSCIETNNKAYVLYLPLSSPIFFYLLFILGFHPPSRAVPWCSRRDYEL